MTYRRYIRAAALLGSLLAAHAAGGTQAETAARVAALQQHSARYPEIRPATSREEIRFQPITLNTNRILYGGMNHDGILFHTGPATGTFYWAFTWSRRIDTWYIIPATGTMDRGFTRFDTGILTQDLAGVAGAGSKICLQTLPPGVLQPNTPYVIWYSFVDAAPVTLAVSAAIVGGPPIPSRQRYPVRKPEASEVGNLEDNEVPTVPAGMVLTHPAIAGKITPLEAGLAAVISNKIVAGEFTSTATAEMNRGIPPEGALLVGFRYGEAGFAGTTIIKTLQPLYLTAAGLKAGQVFGQGHLDRAVLAPPGYAVGALHVKSGHRLDGFRITFMKLLPGRLELDPEQFLVSAWLGGRGGGAPRLNGGTGKPAIGIAIRSGADVDNLGLFLAR